MCKSKKHRPTVFEEEDVLELLTQESVLKLSESLKVRLKAIEE
jgi:hypothetical protein